MRSGTHWHCLQGHDGPRLILHRHPQDSLEAGEEEAKVMQGLGRQADRQASTCRQTHGT